MKNKEKIAKILIDAKEQYDTWWGVSLALYDGKIGVALLSRLANPNDDYWPKDKAILAIIAPKPKPDLNIVKCRNVKIMCNGHFAKEVRDTFSTVERKKIFEDNMKEIK